MGRLLRCSRLTLCFSPVPIFVSKAFTRNWKLPGMMILSLFLEWTLKLIDITWRKIIVSRIGGSENYRDIIKGFEKMMDLDFWNANSMMNEQLFYVKFSHDCTLSLFWLHWFHSVMGIVFCLKSIVWLCHFFLFSHYSFLSVFWCRNAYCPLIASSHQQVVYFQPNVVQIFIGIQMVSKL